MKVYPYRQKDGYRSILEAVDLDDARQHLERYSGRGTLFCEVEMNVQELGETQKAQDSDEQVDELLAGYQNFLI